MFNPLAKISDEQLKEGFRDIEKEVEDGTVTEDRKRALIDFAKELKRRGYELVVE